MESFLANLGKEIKQGRRLGYHEACGLVRDHTVEELGALAGWLRREMCGDRFDLCTIMNARSGRCSEDCKWCSQSAFHRAEIDIYPLVGLPEAQREAATVTAKGVRRFSLVTSGRKVEGSDFDAICTIYSELKHANKDIYLCASLGLLDQSQMEQLKRNGVERYHCNLETAPSYFPHLCTTHTTAQKIETICAAQEAGLEICSGGIIGMGETMEQRLELATTLQELGIRSIPLNILNPIAGTKLEGTPPLSDDELLLSASMFRILNPQAVIRLAGGRILVAHLMGRLLECGVNGSITGDLLTTTGSDIEQDKAFFAGAGFVV